MTESFTTMYAPPVPVIMVVDSASPIEVTRDNIRKVIRGMVGSKIRATFFRPYSDRVKFYPDSVLDVDPIKDCPEEWLPDLLTMLNAYGDRREQMAKERASAAIEELDQYRKNLIGYCDEWRVAHQGLSESLESAETRISQLEAGHSITLWEI